MNKEAVLGAMESLLEQQLNEVEQQLNSIAESKAQETKSSAGDKFETARALMQREEEKLNGQYLRIRHQFDQLKVFRQQNNHSDRVQVGRLVICDQASFFIGLPVGKIAVGPDFVFAVSTDAPLGKLLIGKCIGDSVQLGNSNYSILGIE